MINLTSNFSLDLFETAQPGASGAPAQAPASGDFAALLLGIPVASVAVKPTAEQAAAPVVESVSAQADGKADAAMVFGLTGVLVGDRNICQGEGGCEPSKKDPGLEIFTVRRAIVSFDMPVKPEDAPVKPVLPVKLPAQETPVKPAIPVKLAPVENPVPASEVPVKLAPQEGPVKPAVVPVKLPPQDGPLPAQIPEEGKKKPDDPALAAFGLKRPILDTVSPIKLPVETAPVNGDQPIKQVPAPVRLPAQTGLWSEEVLRDPNKKKEIALSILTRRRPVLEATVVSEAQGGQERTPFSGGTDTSARSAGQGLEFIAPVAGPLVQEPAHDKPGTAVFDQRLPAVEGEVLITEVQNTTANIPVTDLEASTPIFTVVPATSPEADQPISLGNMIDPDGKTIEPVTHDALALEIPLQEIEPAPVTVSENIQVPVNEVSDPLAAQNLPAQVVEKVPVEAPVEKAGRIAEDIPAETPENNINTRNIFDPASSIDPIRSAPLNVPVKQEEKPLLRPHGLQFQEPAPEMRKPLARNPFQVLEPAAGVTPNGPIGQLFRDIAATIEPESENNPPRVGFTNVRNMAEMGPETGIGEPTEFLAETTGNTMETKAENTETKDIFTASIDRFLKTETLKTTGMTLEAKADVIKHAEKILDQVRPGLIELAALTAQKKEKQSMKMRLHPAELGTVDISLERNSSGALTAHFKTDNDAARQALANNFDQLRGALQNAGWEVKQLEISSGTTPFASGQDSGREGSQNSGGTKNYFFEKNSEQPEELDQDPSRLLNLRA